MDNSIRKLFVNFIIKFTIIHVLTYTIFGILFMLISGYFEVFEKDPILNDIMKPADALSVRLAVPFQFIRGALLASAIYPFRNVISQKPYGWLKLFWMLFVLTSIGAVITGPGSIEGFIYTYFPFDPLIGLPEIIVQMFAFSWIFSKWLSNTGSKNDAI